LGLRVRKLRVILAIWLPWASLSVMGCAGVSGSDGSTEPAIVRVSHADDDDPEASDETTTSATGSTSGTTNFAHSARRRFPDQGWWCSDYTEWLSPERADKGYTIILTGVEGTSFHNVGIARGLIEAGHPAAVEVRDWTTGHWPLFVYHLMALERNKEKAREIAEQILKYQTQYPGRPVTLIGHSGGAAMAVLTLEALPADRNVDQVVLLAAAISPDYDLTTALARSEKGIVNYYSWGDVPHLVVGTLALGTLDRQHTVSAGARGFRVPADLDDAGRELYTTRLQQVPYQLSMLKSLNAGGHTGPTNHKFVADWVAPRLAQK
jgi:pimeloyl-ACP methyl ester carboxylesterase